MEPGLALMHTLDNAAHRFLLLYLGQFKRSLRAQTSPNPRHNCKRGAGKFPCLRPFLVLDAGFTAS